MKVHIGVKSLQSEYQYKGMHKSKFEKCRNEVDPLKGEDSFKAYIQDSEKSQLQSAWSQQYCKDTYRPSVIINYNTIRDNYAQSLIGEDE
jgi:hypothetical protein